jgi:hypothetical protein
MAPDGLPHQVIGTEELVSILGPRPYSKSVDYDAFINAAWNPTDAQRAAAAAAAAPAAPASAPTPEAEVDAAGVTAAVREVPK